MFQVELALFMDYIMEFYMYYYYAENIDNSHITLVIQICDSLHLFYVIFISLYAKNTSHDLTIKRICFNGTAKSNIKFMFNASQENM